MGRGRRQETGAADLDIDQALGRNGPHANDNEEVQDGPPGGLRRDKLSIGPPPEPPSLFESVADIEN